MKKLFLVLCFLFTSVGLYAQPASANAYAFTEIIAEGTRTVGSSLADTVVSLPFPFQNPNRFSFFIEILSVKALTGNDSIGINKHQLLFVDMNGRATNVPADTLLKGFVSSTPTTAQLTYIGDYNYGLVGTPLYASSTFNAIRGSCLFGKASVIFKTAKAGTTYKYRIYIYRNYRKD